MFFATLNGRTIFGVLIPDCDEKEVAIFFESVFWFFAKGIQGISIGVPCVDPPLFYPRNI